MHWVRKKAVRLRAWQLGGDSPMEREMRDQGLIRLRDDGRYELFSQEIAGETGEIAKKGDYFKVDAAGRPYPNRREAFERRHIHLEDDWYEQRPEPLQAWLAEDPPCEETDWLIARGLLRLNPAEEGRYFAASLWGTEETAAKNAVVVFYEVMRDPAGSIQEIDFNFVERTVFEETFEWLG